MTSIYPKHGVCSIKFSYGEKETDAMFYVADVDGPAICGLPIPCELCFVELHCAISTNSDKISFPVIDWASSVAYSQKLNGRWRFCLDPKELNRSVKRIHHHTPTVQEITHMFKGSSVFSKLDARHGCWSVVVQ